MCGLCGVLGPGTAWERDGRSEVDVPWRLAREAQQTAAELTRLLRPSRVRVTATPRFGYSIAFPTGATELATGLAGVWHAIERRRLTLPDPLDR
jgi:hypothetical protein